MFEATFKIAALVENNEQGQHVFQVLKHEDLSDDAGFLALVSRVSSKMCTARCRWAMN